jgi:hypothetical protein
MAVTAVHKIAFLHKIVHSQNQNLTSHNRDNIPIDKTVREGKTLDENETQLIAKSSPKRMSGVPNIRRY